MIDTKDCRNFVSHLMRRLDLSESDCPEAGSWAGTGNTLGSIGLRVGLLGLDEIDQIISKQTSDTRLFGQIAVEAKFLTQEQVDILLVLQHFHRCLDTSAPLVMEGRLGFSELLGLMAEYFSEQSDPTDAPEGEEAPA